MRRKRGSLLIELVVALSIGILILLQLSTFLVTFVQQMHALAKQEQRALQQGAVLDLLMRDLDTAIAHSESDNSINLIILTCWRMSAHEKIEPFLIVWSRLQGRLQRKIGGAVVPQVFGSVLPGLAFDIDKRIMRFVDERNKVVEIKF